MPLQPYYGRVYDNSAAIARMSDLLRRRGEAEAEAARRSGQLWGGLIQQAGTLVGDTVVNMAGQREREQQARQAEGREALERARIDALIQQTTANTEATTEQTNALREAATERERKRQQDLAYGTEISTLLNSPGLTPDQIAHHLTSKGLANRVNEALALWRDVRKDADELRDARQKAVLKLVQGVRLTNYDPEAFVAAAREAVQQGIVTEADVTPLLKPVLEAPTPKLQQLAVQRMVDTLFPSPQAKPVVVKGNEALVDPDTGQTRYRGPLFGHTSAESPSDGPSSKEWTALRDAEREKLEIQRHADAKLFDLASRLGFDYNDPDYVKGAQAILAARDRQLQAVDASLARLQQRVTPDRRPNTLAGATGVTRAAGQPRPSNTAQVPTLRHLLMPSHAPTGPVPQPRVYEPPLPSQAAPARSTPAPPAATAPPAAAPQLREGQVVQLRNGQVVQITRIHPDGSFDYVPRR